MVHSIPTAFSGLHPPSVLPLSKEGSGEKKRAASETVAKESYIISKHHEKRTYPHTLHPAVQGSASPSPLLLMKKSTSEEGVVEREQEENIQTCTKAIASLRIATEDIRQGTEQSQRESEPQKSSESAHFSMKHFSGSEPGQICVSATDLDLHSGEKDLFGTTETALSHSTFFSKSSVDVRQLGYLGKKDSPSSTPERKDPPSENSKPQ